MGDTAPLHREGELVQFDLVELDYPQDIVRHDVHAGTVLPCAVSNALSRPAQLLGGDGVTVVLETRVHEGLRDGLLGWWSRAALDVLHAHV